jgi:hypothetical protein
MRRRAQSRRAIWPVGLGHVRLGVAVAIAFVAWSPTTGLAASNQVAAQKDAAALLAALPLPPGSIPSATEPAGDGGGLTAPEPDVYERKIVDDGGWWIVPGPPQAMLDYLVLHAPRASTIGRLGPGTGGIGSQELNWAPIPGVLAARALIAKVVELPDGSTGLRADAVVAPVVQRPAANHIPGATRRVFASVLGPGRNARSVVVVTPREVTQLVRLFNALVPYQDPFRSCPPGLPNAQLRFGFYAASGPAPLAVASIDLLNCGGVQITIRGHAYPELQIATPSGETVFRALERAFGPRFRLPAPFGPAA